MQMVCIKKYFVFTVGSVCRVKRLTTGLRKSQMMKRRCGINSDKSQNFHAAGFDALVKRWDKCINVGGGYVEK
jgi:hypothetical protein